MKGLGEKIENEAKEQKIELLSVILLGTLGARLGKIFTSKGKITAGEDTITDGRNF